MKEQNNVELLGRAFLALPDIVRVVTLLYYYDEMSVEEIAEAMEIYEGIVVGCLMKGWEMREKKCNAPNKLEKENIQEAISEIIEKYPIPELALRRIGERYFMAMGLKENCDEWLFPSANSNGHVSDKAVKYRFEKILLRNNIILPNRERYQRGPCLHCMRHVFAFTSFTNAERAGWYLNDAIPYLSIYLGHDSLNETSKYLKFSNEIFPESIATFGDFMSDLLPEVDNET